MASPKAQAGQGQQVSQDVTLYPVVEAFVERASPDDVGQFFQSVKDGLQALKGPRAEQAKKIQSAIERTEELLHHLLQVREKIEAERKPAQRAR